MALPTCSIIPLCKDLTLIFNPFKMEAVIIYRNQSIDLQSKPFQDGGRYHIETSLLICRANQWTGFYMITASVLKGLKIILIFNKTQPHHTK